MAERTIDKRTLILDTAVCVFARKGFHAARVGDVAEEAGVVHGLLYHYLGSWLRAPDLIRVPVREVARIYGALEEILTGWVLGQLPDAEEDVESAVRTVVEVVCRRLAPEHAGAGR